MNKPLALVLTILSLAATEFSAQAQTQAMATSSVSRPATVEYYYRIRWGSGDEFKRLYERNHAPILREMQRQGFIVAMKMEEPFTHLSGGARWDLRVTLTFRDAADAVTVGGAYDAASNAAATRLYPNLIAFEAEEARRFSLLEEHWDVIVTPVAAE